MDLRLGLVIRCPHGLVAFARACLVGLESTPALNHSCLPSVQRSVRLKVLLIPLSTPSLRRHLHDLGGLGLFGQMRTSGQKQYGC